MSRSSHTITPERFDAVLFDLDGVLTATASVHAASWKKMFDAFLHQRATETNTPFQPFGITMDYLRYVDGKPRYEGVRSFLGSRSIDLPYGDPEEPPNSDTICGLGNRKQELVQEILASEGVEVYEDALALLHHLRHAGIKTAVVSSSRNCQVVLEAAGIAELFDIRVDGEVAARLHLPGKPAPDTFLHASEQLGVDPQRAVVIEDALSGVQAGRAGGFGWVIGVDRHGEAEALKEHGADVVLNDLADLL